MVNQRNRQAGFTLVETVAGLAVLLLLVGIVAVFLGPVFTGIPAFNDQNRETVEIAQLQVLLDKIGGELEIPWWWPQNCFEIAPTACAIRNLGSKYTLSEKELPDLLDIKQQDHRIVVTWQKLAYQFAIDRAMECSGIINDQKRLVGITIKLKSQTDEKSLVLPLSSIPFAN